MRKLLGSWARLTAPVIATAFLAGCSEQKAPEQHAQAEKGQLGEVAELCGFVCKSFASGEVNISGNRSVDAFFSAAANLEAQAGQLEAGVKADLLSIAGILGVTVGADASISDISAAVAANIDGGFGGMIEGGVTLEFVPPQCSVTAEAQFQAAAKCEADVQPGSVEVECKGECVAEADVQASCEGSATLTCKGTAPSFECTGMCSGSCDLKAGGSCSGECKGTCTVDAAADCDGTFTADETAADGSGSCAVRGGAKCEGTCTGMCDLKAEGSCSGECKGECTYEPGSAGCEGGAKASCMAEANATVMCKGECRGEAEPPSVSAECEASVKAEADLNAECTPPSVGVAYTLSAEAEAEFSADVSAQAAFEAKIEAFANAYGELVTKLKKIEIVVSATGPLVEAGGNAVSGVVGDIAASANVQAAFNASCAVTALPLAVTAIEGAATSLNASIEAIGTVTAATGS